YQDAGRVAAASLDQAVQVGEIAMILCQDGAALADCPGHHAGIREGQEPLVIGRYDVASGGLESSGQAAADHGLVDQDPHDRAGRSRPRDWMSAASRSRFCSITARLRAT